MSKEFQAVAESLANSGQLEAEEVFSITGSEDKIVVRVVRTSRVRKLNDRLDEGIGKVGVSFFGSGTTCTACGGTGRI